MSIFPESMVQGKKRTTTPTEYFYVLDPVHGEFSQYKTRKDYER